MSYILDALRKSEQQRQTIQPETVTERLLVKPPETGRKPKKGLLAALLLGNLLIMGYFFWIFVQKTDTPPRQTIAAHPEKGVLPTTATAQPENIPPPKPAQPSPKQLEIATNLPSIEELVEAKKIPPPQAIKSTQTKDSQDKKPRASQKELVEQPQTNQPIKINPPQIASEKQALTLPKKAIVELNDSTAETQNNFPHLTINVFSYAQQPEDRFVIIDMVKYRIGQLIKGSVTLKEIRPDSIILQRGDETFRVDRP